MISALIGWVFDRWHARRRELDEQVLWPSLLHAAGGDVETARAAFFNHASRDPAWQVLGSGEMAQRISALRVPGPSPGQSADQSIRS